MSDVPTDQPADEAEGEQATMFDDPNREAVGLAPISTGAGPTEPATEPEPEPEPVEPAPEPEPEPERGRRRRGTPDEPTEPAAAEE